jgi:hypothetical protein
LLRFTEPSAAGRDSSRQVRIADGGWTDNVARNGIATENPGVDPLNEPDVKPKSIE